MSSLLVGNVGEVGRKRRHGLLVCEGVGANAANGGTEANESGEALTAGFSAVDM